MLQKVIIKCRQLFGYISVIVYVTSLFAYRSDTVKLQVVRAMNLNNKRKKPTKCCYGDGYEMIEEN